MMSIRTITIPPVASPAGILPAGAAAGESFAALLPAMMVPVMPMAPEGAGKDLPVAGGEDDAVTAGAGTVLWLAPSVTTAIYSGAAAPKSDDTAPDVSLAPPATLGTASSVLPNPLADGNAARPAPGGAVANLVPLLARRVVSPSDAAEKSFAQSPSAGAAVPVSQGAALDPSPKATHISRPLYPIVANSIAAGTSRLASEGAIADAVPPLPGGLHSGAEGMTQPASDRAVASKRRNVISGAPLTSRHLWRSPSPVMSDPHAGGNTAHLLPVGTLANTPQSPPPGATPLASWLDGGGESTARRHAGYAMPPKHGNAAPGVWRAPFELSRPLSSVVADSLAGGDAARLVRVDAPAPVVPLPVSWLDHDGEGVMQRSSEGASVSKCENAEPVASLTPRYMWRSPSQVVADPLAGGNAARLVPAEAPALVGPATMPPMLSRPEAGGPDGTHTALSDSPSPSPESGLSDKSASAQTVADKVTGSGAASSRDRGAHLPAASVQAGPVLQPAEANRIAPAAQVFAAAIQQVVREERRPAAAEQAIVAIAPTTDLAAHAVTAAESSRHAALDMARDTWPAKMIERIEMLRDAANANDTSIRLVPDRLGTIDVSLRRDGDTVAVHFQAQHAETRQLIAEAQPRLADMAEARGLRLSTQTSDGGSHPQQQQQRAGTGTAPTNNVSPDAAQTGASSADERVA